MSGSLKFKGTKTENPLAYVFSSSLLALSATLLRKHRDANKGKQRAEKG